MKKFIELSNRKTITVKKEDSLEKSEFHGKTYLKHTYIESNGKTRIDLINPKHIVVIEEFVE